MIAAVFPGQGSQKPGMGRELAEAFTEADRVFDSVSEALALDVRKLCWDTDEEYLRQTQNAQVALFTAGVASFEALRAAAPDAKVVAFAGHSVGEYAALVAAGVLSVEAGAKLVRKRGELMAAAGSKRPGTMAAVLGLERGDLEACCRDAGGVVVVANDNCPGQLVISGEVEAVDRAGKLAFERGAKRVLPLNVSGAFHSPLMDEPAREMAAALEGVEFSTSEGTVYANVTAEPALDAERWPRLLEDQLRSPVRWTETVLNMRRDGVATFIECGPGEVLSGLIRRCDKEAATLRAGAPDTIALAVEGLK